MHNPYLESPLPRWACALCLVHVAAAAALPTLSLI